MSIAIWLLARLVDPLTFFHRNGTCDESNEGRQGHEVASERDQRLEEQAGEGCHQADEGDFIFNFGINSIYSPKNVS